LPAIDRRWPLVSGLANGGASVDHASMDYLAINRQAWNARTEQHLASKFYDVPGFLAGASSLQHIELAELGDVSGKSVLHLQCHFGLDTLSLAQLGATATGIDLSDKAIAAAQSLAQQTGLDAQFVCTDLYDVAAKVSGVFDVVFTSYGAIGWLPDLQRWAQIIAEKLQPGGIFYMAEFHPHYFTSQGDAYFSHTEPDIVNEGTYTDTQGEINTPLCTWSHPISEILTCLLEVGLKIELFNEFPYSPYNCFEDLEERAPGRFYARGTPEVPMIFSLRARSQRNT
jgi:2-polyprenyl-3-methyl-5-hydroxy-6-metoxy-1,4-benzoquinol methylase